jgi:hypothetical protein
MKLYIDIETIPGPNAPDMQELNPTDYLVGNPPKNYKERITRMRPRSQLGALQSMRNLSKSTKLI